MTLRVIQGGEAAGAALGLVDYVWLDSFSTIHIKKRAIPIYKGTGAEQVPEIKPWVGTVAGSYVALSPCHYLPDPLRPQPSFLALCEVRDSNGVPTNYNYRAKLREILEVEKDRLGVFWGFVQEYNLVHPDEKECEKDAFLVAERHLGACLDAGLMLHSAQFELATHPWQFKVGFRDLPETLDTDPPSALVVADHLILARYLLLKIAREFGLHVQFTGFHLRLSTQDTRTRRIPACEELAKRFETYGAVMGASASRGVEFIKFRSAEHDPFLLAYNILTTLISEPEPTP